MKKLLAVFAAISLMIVVIAPVGYFGYMYVHRNDAAMFNDLSVDEVEYGSQKKKVLEPGAEFSVLLCQVIDGYKFRIRLENGEWIKARLAIVTKEGSAKDVAGFLRASGDPVVVLKRKVEGCWIVDIRLTIEGKSTMLRGLLEEKGIAL